LVFSISVVLAQSDYVIGPEDKLTIRVWGHEDLTTIARVSQKGKIVFPFIGEVEASGHTPGDLALCIARLLADGYLVDPQVTVEVLEYKSQRVYVLGEVKSPGAFSLTKRIHLMEALSLAGGPTAQADEEIMLVRPKNPRTGPALPTDVEPGEVISVRLLEILEGDREQNIQIRPGDTIYIPRVKVFYITGEVTKPGRYDYRKHMTVLDAISTAGGLTEQAAAKRTRIIRNTEDGQRQELRVTMEDPISPGDSIVVPESFF
jgi:polysaccharide export outer membrane protein